ncbi:sensor histidine kinase response [Paraphaeosphaeria sporulosa]
MTAPSGIHPLPTPPAFPNPAVSFDGQDPSWARSSNDTLAFHFFRCTPIPTVLLDSSLVIRQVSDSYLEVSGGYGADQVLGLRSDDFFDQMVTIPSRDSANKAIRAAKETRVPYQMDNVQADGTVWNIRAIPVYDAGSLLYIQIELQDATEERRKQLELEERLYMNETFRILVETVNDYAIFMLDPQGNVATWNAGAQSFKGYTREEITGKHFSNFYSQKDRDDGKPGRELVEALRDGRCEDEGWRYRKDGTRFWANVVITPIYRGDNLIGFAKVTRDLSERRKAEKKLIAAYEEASKLKSEFLANMSHEIRTPMHGMLSALTLLADTRLDSEQLELVRIAEESGEVLLQVINDILDYSKLESGGFSISNDIISVTDVVQSVFSTYQNGCEPGITLENHLDPRLPKVAEGDSLRYRQIVQNLMSNATKFTKQGYVRLNATLQKEDDESYTILTEVVDTGVGVASASSSALFAPFTQFDNSATKQYKGTGLGLSICKSLAERMGGNVGFQPNPEGRGSIFWFTAKLKKVKQLSSVDTLQEKTKAQAVQTPALPLEEFKLAAANKKVLLTEDNPINQRVMLKMLKGLGFGNVDVAVDGRKAVTMLTKDPLAYHVILMDINMPVLDGVRATKEIRDAGIYTPIVAMTANALKGQVETYIAKGMSAYVSKPVDRRLLVEALSNCLRMGNPT